MRMILPRNVSYIINKLEEKGYEAYAVGGCVRDTILGREPEDWDITTSAQPMEIKGCFKKTIDTGIQHGTVTVMLDHTGYEVTTYRIDGEYEDNRHPKSVEFTNNLRLDLERRDFTINAMAYNDSVGLVDEFDGIGDIENKIIRCVGDAGQRFDEDALRMLRAIRFSGQLDFKIEENTREAITVRVEKLKNISAERIRVELSKLIISKASGQIREVYNTGMSVYFLPELDAMMKVEQKNPHHVYTVGEHSIRSVENMNFFFGKYTDSVDISLFPQDIVERVRKITKNLDKKEHIILCMTMLLHDIAKPKVMFTGKDGVGHFYGHPERSEEMARVILRRLTFDNDTIGIVRRLIRFHDIRINTDKKSVRRAVSKIGKDIMEMLFLVQYADIFAQNPATFDSKLKQVSGIMDIYHEVIAENSPLTIKDLEVNGRDLIESGVKPGPVLGDTLEKLLEIVLDDPQKNKKQILLDSVKKMEGDSPNGY